MSLLAMFPGQGSQFVGMGSELRKEFPASQVVFEEASDTIGIDVGRLCAEGPDEQLVLTENTQPCILTVSVAVYRVLRDEIGLKPSVFMGHSLGEYAALVCSERMGFKDAIALVRQRGMFMQSAVPVGIGAMAAILKVSEEKLAKLCGEYKSSEAICEIVNYNSPAQLVVAGHAEAVDQVCREVVENLSGRAVRLPVSAPFHSSLMSSAREQMSPLVDATTFTDQESWIVPNLTAEPVQAYAPDFLKDQIDHPVKWFQSLEAVSRLKITRAIEVGPGKVLYSLARRQMGREVALIHTENVRSSLETVLGW